jgi:integrase-like protein
LAEDLPALMDGRIFRQWTNLRAFKAYWEATVRRVGLHDLRFHDLRHTFATRLQRLGVEYETRQALLGHRMPGVTADYSHGGPEWDRLLRDAMTRLEKGYVLVDELADERQAAKAVGSISLKTGEPAGIRTQDPRLKRAGEREENQQLDLEESSNE